MLLKRGFIFDKKYIIVKCEILLQHNGFLFYYILKYRPISVMPN